MRKIKLLAKTILAKFVLAILFCTPIALTSCLDEQAPGSYYTFTGETVAEFLNNYPNNEFSTFVQVLKKADLWGQLQTYGEYTCLAPTNEAFEAYFKEKGIEGGVENLSWSDCDTISRTHLLESTFYCTDLIEGTIPYPNMLDRYLTYTCDSDTVRLNKAVYVINKTARLLERDDTVQNGVVHIVNVVIQPSTDFLPDIIKADSSAKIFWAALELTHMHDSLTYYLDANYKEPGGDSCTEGIHYSTGLETERGTYPAKRYFKYTGFVEKDEVFNKAGIYNIEDLKAYAKRVYDESYPEDAGKYDEDFTDRKNPLNRFVSYHFLESECGYNAFNVTNTDIIENFVKREYLDLEDYFETMMPHSIMRISSPKSPAEVYINRKGTAKSGGVSFEGVRIGKPAETKVNQSALNGQYHYIDNILAYSNETRTQALNVRMRIDATTMSPDFINSGGRNRLLNRNDRISTGLKRGFVKNVDFSDETIVYVRYRDNTFACYCGDEVAMKGIYDITFKLPPVPTSGTYEIRLGYPAMDSRGVIQIYFNGMPCDIPLDLRISGTDARIGWVSDGDLGTENDIQMSDKAMRNRGYMKGMDIYANNNSNFRDQSGLLRRILTTEYLYSDQDNYIRVRQVLDNDKAEFPFDYLELVPKSIYQGETPEDRH